MIKFLVPLLMVLFTFGKGSYAITPEVRTNVNMKASSLVWPEIKVKATLGSVTTSTFIKFNEAMKFGLDIGYDAGIMKSGFDVYTRLVEDNGVDFGIQCLPMTANSEMIVPIGIESSTGGTLTLSAELSNLPTTCQFVFEDRVLGTFKTITANETLTTLSVQAKSKITDRFYLRINFIVSAVKTLSTSSVTTTDAVINCSIEAGTANARGVAYGTEPNPDLSANKIIEHGQFEKGNYSLALSWLIPGTTYCVRSFVITVADTIWGNEIGFSTKTKTTLIITAQNQSKIYGEENPALTCTYSGFINGDNENVLDIKPEITTNATKGSKAGSYGIMVSGGYDNDYEFSYQSGELIIAKAKLTATVGNVSSRVCVIPDFTVTYSGFVNGDSITDLDQLPVASTTANTLSLPGDYPIVLSVGADDNYEFVYKNGTLTLDDKMLPSIDWMSPSAITYGQVLDETQLNASSTVSGEFVYTPSVGTLLKAGKGQKLQVEFFPDDSINYKSVSKLVTIDVEKALLTVKANDKTIVYGEPIPELTYTTEGFVNGESLSTLIFELSTGNNSGMPAPLTTLPTAKLGNGQGVDAGIYPITVSGGSAANYNFVYSDGKLTVEKALLTVQVANGQMVVGTDVPKLGITLSGFSYSDSETSIDTMPKVVSSVSSTTPVGEYEIVANGGADNNYNFEYKSGVLKIVPKQTPMVSWKNPDAIVYGTQLSSVQLNATSNIEGKFVYTPSTGTLLGAGEKQALTVIFTPNSTAYEIVADTVFITIEKKDLRVTAQNQTIEKGNPLPNFTLYYDGFVNGDSESNLDQLPIASTTATLQSEAGEYPINIESGADDNYNLLYTNGLLTIQKKNGIADLDSHFLNVFKNTNTRSITIENTSPQQGTYLLVDLNGRRIASGKVHCGKTSLQSPPTHPGIYLLKLKLGQNDRVYKLSF